MRGKPILAIDWGTTNRRIYRIGPEGTVEATERDDRGVRAIARERFGDEVVAIRRRFGDLPMLCAGMVGSINGWVEAPYRACPVGLHDLAQSLTWVEAGRTAIVPGVNVIDRDRSDVMRGEEVQLLGAVAAGLAPPDALLCQPGTHCKWAHMIDGRISAFRTTMTGELFALLEHHSLLADFMDAPVADGPAFRRGVAAAAEGQLLGDLFGARANVLNALSLRSDVAAYVSGLLIGTDVNEQRISPEMSVYVLADPTLGGLYGTAIEAAAGTSVIIDSHAAFVAGIVQLRDLIA